MNVTSSRTQSTRLRKASRRKTQFLDEDGHSIEFAAGEAVAVHCPSLGRCPIVQTEF